MVTGDLVLKVKFVLILTVLKAKFDCMHLIKYVAGCQHACRNKVFEEANIEGEWEKRSQAEKFATGKKIFNFWERKIQFCWIFTPHSLMHNRCSIAIVLCSFLLPQEYGQGNPDLGLNWKVCIESWNIFSASQRQKDGFFSERRIFSIKIFSKNVSIPLNNTYVCMKDVDVHKVNIIFLS